MSAAASKQSQSDSSARRARRDSFVVIRATKSLLAALLLATAATATAATPAAAAAPAPVWSISSFASPSHFLPDDSTGLGVYAITAANIGAAPTSGTLTITDVLPPGLSADPDPVAQESLGPLHAIDDRNNFLPSACLPGPPVTCTITTPVRPGGRVYVFIPVDTAPPAVQGSTLTNQVSVSGGGAPDASATEQTPVDSDPAPFGFQSLGSYLTATDGSAETRAGSHPYQFDVNFELNTLHNFNPNAQDPNNTSPGSLKDVVATLPRGLVVDPSATPVRCTEAQFENPDGTTARSCPDASAVGVAFPTQGGLGGFASPDRSDAVYNMVTPPGAPASFGVNAYGTGVFIHLLGGVDPAGGYSLSGSASRDHPVCRGFRLRDRPLGRSLRSQP